MGLACACACAIAAVVAGALEARLFVTLGTVSTTTGPSAILGVAVTGIIAMCIAAYYSWIGTIFSAAGGAYIYLSRTFNSRFLGFVLLTVLFIVNLGGFKGYNSSQTVMFGLLVAAMLVLVVPGEFVIDTANYQPFFTGGVGGFVGSLVPLFYAYIGIEAAAQLGAEIKNLGRNLPLAIYLPSLAIGLVVSTIDPLLGERRGAEANDILDTLPGVEGETISSRNRRR